MCDECHTFNECKGKLSDLICQKIILSVKEYNVKRHYETEHKLKLTILLVIFDKLK